MFWNMQALARKPCASCLKVPAFKAGVNFYLQGASDLLCSLAISTIRGAELIKIKSHTVGYGSSQAKPNWTYAGHSKKMEVLSWADGQCFP